MTNDWDDPNSTFLEKCRPKVIAPETIRKMSCENLYKRATCLGGKTVETTTSEGTKVQNLVFNPTETKIPQTLGYTFDKVLHELDVRTCPPVPVSQLKQKIESEFPNHRVKRWRNTVQLPSTFSKNELTELEAKLPDISHDWYILRENKRLNRHYVSPKSKSELERNE